MTPESHASEKNNLRQRQKVHVVLPAYNEESRIGSLLDNIDRAMSEEGLSYRVIVVDDGSIDKTLNIARNLSSSMPLTIIRHTSNQGLGATLRDGLITAMESAKETDIIITMDADDTHSPGLIIRMVRMIREGCDVVIASRYRPGSRVYGVPPARRILSYLGSFLFRIVFPTTGVRDFTSGFRAYRVGILSKALQKYGRDFVDQEGFQCMVDILLKLRRSRPIFGEVPMILRYDLKEGASKMRITRTVVDTLLLMARRRMGR